LARQIERLVERSQLTDAMVYLQLTRGQSPRNHPFPDPAAVPPTLLFYVRALPRQTLAAAVEGAHIVSVPDERWKRCWVKSIALLPNVLAKQVAISGGFDEALFIDEGLACEGASSNLFAVIDGAIVTPPIGKKVLPGITRHVLSEIAAEQGISWVERALPESEARAARELFITSTTREVHWVASWDRKPVTRACGPVTRKLHDAYQSRIAAECALELTVVK
jgi:D-alanine transaminase